MNAEAPVSCLTGGFAVMWLRGPETTDTSDADWSTYRLSRVVW